MVTLRLINENDPFRPAASRDLSAGELTLGRDPTADWRIDDPDRRISRIHCVFAVDREGQVSVRDTSSNGVFRESGDRLPLGEPQPVAIGEGVRIGNFMVYVDRVLVSPPLAEPASASTPAPAVPPVHDGTLIEAFCQGAQLDASAFAGQDPADLLRRLGAIYRQTIGGLGQLMEDRSNARQGIDLDLTTISASANNPFKWASPARVTLDLLRGSNGSFMAGAEAVASSFHDLREHMAALAGTAHAAIAATLETLHPDRIEAEGMRQGSGLFAGGRAGAAWKYYRGQHQLLVERSDQDAARALAAALRVNSANSNDRSDDK